jgi:hypothetical protein
MNDGFFSMSETPNSENKSKYARSRERILEMASKAKDPGKLILCGFCGSEMQIGFTACRCIGCGAFIHVRVIERDSGRAAYGIGTAWVLSGWGVTEKRFRGVTVVDEFSHADDEVAVVSVHDPSELITTRQAAALMGVAYVTFVKAKSRLLTPVSTESSHYLYRVGDVLKLRDSEIARVARGKRLSSELTAPPRGRHSRREGDRFVKAADIRRDERKLAAARAARAARAAGADAAK